MHLGVEIDKVDRVGVGKIVGIDAASAVDDIVAVILVVCKIVIGKKEIVAAAQFVSVCAKLVSYTLGILAAV